MPAQSPNITKPPVYDDFECVDTESLNPVLTPSYIDDMISKKLLWTKLSLINVPGDGHCFMYSVYAAMKVQLVRDVHTNFLKMQLLQNPMKICSTLG